MLKQANWTNITVNTQKGTLIVSLKKKKPLDFPGGPVVKTLCSQYRGCGLDPWSGN